MDYDSGGIDSLANLLDLLLVLQLTAPAIPHIPGAHMPPLIWAGFLSFTF